MADQLIEHLLRRAGFGASSAELTAYSQLSYTQAVDRLVNYTDIPDTVDSHIGQAGYVNTTSRGPLCRKASSVHGAGAERSRSARPVYRHAHRSLERGGRPFGAAQYYLGAAAVSQCALNPFANIR